MKPEKIRKAMPELMVKWKVFVFFAVFTVLMIAVLWLFQTVFLDEFYETIKVKNMRSAGELVKTTEDADMDSICEKYDVDILVLNKDLETIDIGSRFKNGYILRISPRLADYVYYSTLSSDMKELLLEVSDPMGEMNGMPKRMIFAMIGDSEELILIETTITALNTTVETLRIQLYWVMAVFLLVGMGFAIAISRSTSKPIEKITRSAKKLAEGNYSTDFTVKGYKEIHELSETLNYASRELSKVEDMRKELLANLSHDLRTPLTMITAYAEMMRDIPGELTSENVQVIVDESSHLTNLVNDLLDLSRIQDGAHMLNKVRYNFTKSMFALKSRYKKLTEQEDYDIEFIYDQEVYVYADEAKITQVTYNLINNAVNYTGADKKIIIRQLRDGNKVRVEIQDTGEGIPENQLLYIWDRYYKVEGTHKRPKHGTGIGLSIVKGIMELHNERYGVSSILGEGSVFWFELTLDDE